jgi:nucleoside-diphosphate-sugar epimerase
MAEKKPRVLVTGLTGFLGSHVRPLLEPRAKVTSISRSDPKAVNGDLSFWDGRLDPKQFKGQFDILLHMAGLYNLRINPIEARRQNMMTTHAALALAQKAEIPQFIYTSTVAVTVRSKKIVVLPDDIDHDTAFPDQYCYSKVYAESMVKYWSDGIPSRLSLRLGILVGDQEQGKIKRIDGPYHAAETFKKLKNLISGWPGPFPVPGRRGRSLPVVPVDVAAKAIVDLLVMGFKKPWPRYKSLFIAPKEGLKTEKFYDSLLNHFGISKRLTFFENIPTSLSKYAAEWFADLPKEEVEYLLNLPRLDTSETENILGQGWCPEFSSYEDIFWKGYEDYVSHS